MNCIIEEVIIELYYVYNKQISQKVCIVAKHGGFPFTFLKRENQGNASSNTIFEYDIQKSMNNCISKWFGSNIYTFYSWIWRKLMKCSYCWENAGNGRFTWSQRSTRNYWLIFYQNTFMVFFFFKFIKTGGKLVLLTYSSMFLFQNF